MTRKGGAVLVLTDLTPRSDTAMVAAVAMAMREGMELYVLYALDLRNRPLREALISLESITSATERARANVRAQMQRLVPESLNHIAPIIELDSRDVALRRCVQHISPTVVLYADGDEIIVRDRRRPAEPVPA